jgi:hypothetical protein
MHSLNHNLEPELEIKLKVPDWETFDALRHDRYIGYMTAKGPRADDNWHEQVTGYFDSFYAGNSKTPPHLQLNELGACLRIRHFTNFAPIPSNQNLDLMHKLTVKVEHGLVKFHIPGLEGAGFLLRSEYNKAGLQDYNPDPLVWKGLKEWGKEEAESLAQYGGLLPIGQKGLKICINTVQSAGKLRLMAGLYYIRHDRVAEFKGTHVACCFDQMEMRRRDGETRTMYEMELELVPREGTSLHNKTLEQVLAENEGFRELASYLVKKYGVTFQPTSKAALTSQFVMEALKGNPAAKPGVIWPQAAKRMGLPFRKPERQAYDFMLSPTPHDRAFFKLAA